MSRQQKRIYFMKPIGMDGPIKVGCSQQPDSRLKSVSLWSPFPLEVICTAPGEHRDENNLHYCLRDHQFNGEWFTANPVLAAIIEHVQHHGVLPTLEVPPRRERKGAIPRAGFTAVSLAKSNLTNRIGRAERHAYGWEKDGKRPANIAAIYDEYHDPLAPVPTGGKLEAVEAYIAALMAMPRADRSNKAWRLWRSRVDTPTLNSVEG